MVKIDDDLKRKVLLHLCNHDSATNKEIEKAIGIEGAYITRTLKKLKSCVTTSIGEGNTKPRSIKKDHTTFAKLLEMFIGTKHQEEFFQSLYVKDIDIHNPEIDRIVKKIILNHMKTVQFVLNAFYPDIPLTEHLNLALSSDARWKLLLEQCAMLAILMFARHEVDQSSASDEDEESFQLILMFFKMWCGGKCPTAFDSTDITNGGKLDHINFKPVKIDLIPYISQTATPDP